jgi:hypothetical protein
VIVGAEVDAVFAAMGIGPQALMWSMLGSILGAPLAKSAGRIRQGVVFVVVVFAGALLGTIAAHRFHAGDALYRMGWCFALAGAFHPMSSAFVKAVPALVAAVAASIALRVSAASSADEAGKKDGDRP